MSSRRDTSRPRWRLAAGLLAGVAIGTGLIAVGVFSTTVDAQPSPGSGVTGLRDVLHSPPLFVRRSEGVTLRYEAVCQADEIGAPCPIRGTLFVRDSSESSYRRVPLQVGRGSALTATLPSVGESGLAYYAQIEDGLGGSRSVPAGGAMAPQRAWVADDVVRVGLGVHSFGRTRAPMGSVVRAPWGARSGAAGLLTGKDLVRIGPSAFDVAPDRSVVVLDQVNDRLAVYPAGGGAPRHIPIPFSGGEGDLATGSDGTIHVLDHGAEPVVRSFSSAGALVASVAVHDRSSDMLRAGPTGPLLHGFPGDLWFPLRRGGQTLQPAEQARSARPGLSVGGGDEIVVRGGPREATFAVVRGERVMRAWRVSSETDLGEIQLAEPLGADLLVVLRVWTEARAEFVALVLADHGLRRSISIDAIEWAESGALSRFRLHGDTLYQLRSASSGVEIATFDLGGAA